MNESRSQKGKLDNTALLDWSGDLSQRMVAALHSYLDRRLVDSKLTRDEFWSRDFSSPQAYTQSVEPNRIQLAELIGVVDSRAACELSFCSPASSPGYIAETRGFTVQQVSWTVLEGITGTGLLLEPKTDIRACLVAIPDADQTPEQISGLAPGIAEGSQFTRTLAENGVLVVVPSLVNRDCAFSGNEVIGYTNQSHREWIYRQAYEMGRHIIGIEVQKVMAVVDWFIAQFGDGTPIGLAGYGEGGLLAFYTAALDERIQATMVSGYFGPRENIWREPLYRNIWGLLRQFGDAEIASLIAPRSLVVEFASEPEVEYSPQEEIDPEDIKAAAPGKLVTPTSVEVKVEFERIIRLSREYSKSMFLISGPDGTPSEFGSWSAMEQFAKLLDFSLEVENHNQEGISQNYLIDDRTRQRQQVKEMENYIQRMISKSELSRKDFFLSQMDITDIDGFVDKARCYRRHLWEELIGRLEQPQAEINPRSRVILEREGWIGYEVVLNVWDDVFVWGILCLPRDLRQDEKRPVVVCQHGLECLPIDTIEDTEKGLMYYRRLSARLADRGFVVFAPHNPYRGGYRYKSLQRKANPLKASLGSIIIAQHTQILNWLESLPFVDPKRIGFYGISYGGWTAVRIPPVIERYCLSICSAAFNDWIRKVTSVDFIQSYMAYADFEMCEWNAGHTFSNAEMAYLMIPRAFMVERGMHDPVASDSWVASEYAKVRWLYTQLGISERTEIEYFNGEHVIHGEGTFDFLHKHLDWPKKDIES